MPDQKQTPEYNFKKIEKKWREKWEADKLYQPNLDKAEKPFYNLMMFPYPSAEGLHVGNMYAFTGADVYGRFKKMQGFDVFEPIGLDGFGIHSENYAMKIGEHIKDVSKKSEKNFYRQMSLMGNMYDWSRTVETYKPEYYKWTQWLFLQLFNKGLAYQKKAKVNWCPSCKTVLSDEQVIQGECERCDSQVEKKELKQWFFKITDYAERLLKNLDWIDWSEDVKTNQRNWIGKSEGAKVKFQVTEQSSESIKIRDVKDFRKKLNINSSLKIKGKEFKIEQIVKFRLDDGSSYIKVFLESNYVLADDLDENTFTFLKEIKTDIKMEEKEVSFDGKKYDFSYQTGATAEEICGKEIFAKGDKEIFYDYINGNDYLSLGIIKKTGERADCAGEAILSKDVEIISKQNKEDVLILHGWEGDSQTGWIPSTKKYLEKLGHKVYAFDAPDTDTPVFEEWFEFINNKIKENNLKDFSIIGHSMGGHLAVKLAEKYELKKLVLVAPVGFEKPNSDYFNQFKKTLDFDGMEIFKKYQNRDLNIEAVKKNSGSIEIIFGGKDPWITSEIRDFYQKNFAGTNIQVLENNGHFMEREGVTRIPELEVLFNSDLEVFTTRPDTLFGVTYMVLAPEHKLIEESKSQIENWDEVKKYIEKAKSKSEQERKEDEKEKTGVEIKGLKAINPVNNEEIPIWIADYVLAGYGTGAIMAVPAHDQRDFEFAKKYGIEIREVVTPMYGSGERDDEVCRETISAVIKRKSDGKFLFLKVKEDCAYGAVTPVIGGIKEGESIEDATKREVKEETGFTVKSIEKLGGKIESHFYAGHKKVWRKRIDQPVLVELENKEAEKISEEEAKKHDVFWLSEKEVLRQISFPDVVTGLLRVIGKDKAYSESGRAINSDFLGGLKTEEAKQKIIKWLEEKNLGEKAIDYKLRDWCVSRQRYWGPPIPIIYCDKCGVVPVPEKDLPVELPDMEDFLPEGKGKGPLAKNEEFVNTTCPKCCRPAKRETDVSDPFVDSAWYFLRYPSTEFHDEAINKKRSKNWLPVDSYIGGKEHTVLHLLYSRFITMVLSDLKYIEFEEPYKRFFGHGLITKDGAKMSKSKGNVINPDEMLEKYGVDTVRLYLRFLGDFSQGGDWQDNGADGMARFMNKLWHTFFELSGAGKGVEKTQMIDKTIKVIGEDIEKLSFNTAVARYMEFVNWVRENSADFNQKQVQKIKETLAFTIAPMAPFVAEEFWSVLENKNSIFTEKWPTYNKDNIQDNQFELVVQINGKVRDRIEVSRNITEEEAQEISQKTEKIKKHLEGQTVRKIIYIKEKLINIVV